MMTKRILLPLRRGDAARAIAPLVADMARSSGATVRLINVAPVPTERVSPDGRVVAYANQEMERVEFSRRDDLRIAEAELEGVPVESVVRFGDPAREILLEAEAYGADLIALTEQHRSWWSRAFGGVVRTLLRQSPVPVLLLALR